MRKMLKDFLDNSSPEQLREELKKGNRPFFQTLKDPTIIHMKNIKVNVTLEFEFPFNENDEVYKTVFENLVNYALCEHLEDASYWLAKSKGNKKSTDYEIYVHHKLWADVLTKSELNVNYEVIFPKEPTKSYWVKDDGIHCPICGVEMDGCHIGSFCSKEKGGCGKWCDGRADLTDAEAEKFKEIIIR